MALGAELLLVAIKAKSPLLEAGSVQLMGSHPIGCVRHRGFVAVHAAILSVAKLAEGLLLLAHVGMLLLPIRIVERRRRLVARLADIPFALSVTVCA